MSANSFRHRVEPVNKEADRRNHCDPGSKRMGRDGYAVLDHAKKPPYGDIMGNSRPERRGLSEPVYDRANIDYEDM